MSEDDASNDKSDYLSDEKIMRSESAKGSDDGIQLPEGIWWKIGLGVILLLLIFGAIEFGLNYNQQVPVSPVKPLSSISMSALQIAINATGFFGPVSNPSTVDFESCSFNGKCVPQLNVTDRSYAWRMFANIGLFDRTHNPKYQGIIQTDFSYLQTAKQLDLPFWSTFQVGESYKVTKSQPMLIYFYSNTRDMLNALPGLPLDSPMLEATESRELSLAVELMNRPDAQSILYQTKYLTNSTPELSLAPQQALFLNGSVVALGRAMTAVSKQPPIFSDMPDFKQDSCWIVQAEYELYAASGNQTYLNSVQDVFNRAHFASRPLYSFNVQNPSQIHPCIQTLQDLASPTNSYAADADFLLQNFVVRAWDSSRSPICNGDSGFLANLPSNPADNLLCQPQYKSDSDAGYSIYLLARDNSTSFLLPN